MSMIWFAVQINWITIFFFYLSRYRLAHNTRTRKRKSLSFLFLRLSILFRSYRYQECYIKLYACWQNKLVGRALSVIILRKNERKSHQLRKIVPKNIFLQWRYAAIAIWYHKNSVKLDECSFDSGPPLAAKWWRKKERKKVNGEKLTETVLALMKKKIINEIVAWQRCRQSATATTLLKTHCYWHIIILSWKYWK